MSSSNSAFDDFVDDCLIDEDPLCGFNNHKTLELVPSQLISDLVAEDQEINAA